MRCRRPLGRTSVDDGRAERDDYGMRDTHDLTCRWPNRSDRELSDWCDAVRLMPDGPATTDAEIPTTTTTDRKTARMRQFL